MVLPQEQKSKAMELSLKSIKNLCGKLTSDKGAKARQEERGPGPQMVLEQLAILQRKKMSLET